MATHYVSPQVGREGLKRAGLGFPPALLSRKHLSVSAVHSNKLHFSQEHAVALYQSFSNNLLYQFTINYEAFVIFPVKNYDKEQATARTSISDGCSTKKQVEAY